MRTRAPEPARLLLALLALAGLLPRGAAAQREAGASARPLVVVDAGHGGVDAGARGPRGTREKDVTLAVARELASVLRERSGYEIRLTRARDTLIALRDRPRLANRWRGGEERGGRPAVFISIHANAHRDPRARGFETFFLSDAKTEDARRVAEMENAAQRFEQVDRRDADPLSFIFNDLKQNLYLHDSSAWAERIQSRMEGVHGGPNRGVKQAGFVVLDGAFMPAVLVELGFITNPAEERMLADPAAQRRLALQLARAVEDFFDERGKRESAALP